jgi:hypothetical protein
MRRGEPLFLGTEGCVQPVAIERNRPFVPREVGVAVPCGVERVRRAQSPNPLQAVDDPPRPRVPP